MSLLARLENRFGHWAIPSLLRYVAGLNALCFLLIKLVDPNFVNFLALDRTALLNGEVWRLITYLFIPSMGGLFFPDWFSMAFYVIYLFWISDGLEQALGAFRVNVYYLLGMIGTTIAALISNGDPGGFMLNVTLLFAFARFFPDAIIYIMFVLPVKVKWMAWFTGAIIILSLLVGGWPHRFATFAALLNYFIFFGREMIEEARTRREIGERRARFEQASHTPEGEALHRCHVCGRTEQSDPEADFRVAADGEEYCADHLPKRV